MLGASKPISHDKPTLTITTDASKLGGGALCDGVSLAGNRTQIEAEHHIDYLGVVYTERDISNSCTYSWQTKFGGRF